MLGAIRHWIAEILSSKTRKPLLVDCMAIFAYIGRLMLVDSVSLEVACVFT